MDDNCSSTALLSNKPIFQHTSMPYLICMDYGMTIVFFFSAAYFSSAAAASLNPYAAAAYAQNMMSTWNGYSIAAYQGLQREGVTYGKLLIQKCLLK